MNTIRLMMYLIAAPLMMISLLAYLWVQFVMRPRADRNLDESYWEFEQTDPRIARYQKYSRITFALAAFSALLLFAVTFI